MDHPICELCGESEAHVGLQFAGACEDCAAKEFRRALVDTLGIVVCGQPLFKNGPRGGRHIYAVCVEKYGVEHDHQP